MTIPLVMNRAARLAIVLILGLAVRASAQQLDPSGGQRGDPYAPQYQPPPFQPAANPPGQYQQPAYQPPASQRYPLPQQQAYPQQQQQQQPGPGLVPAHGNGNPSGPTVQRPVIQPPPLAAQAGTPQGQLFEPALIVGRVGDKAIYYGDVAPLVNQILEPSLAKATSDYERQEVEKYREMLTKNVLKQMVETKLMYLEFEREMHKNVGADAEKQAEVRKTIDKKVRDEFETNLAKMRELIAKATAEQLPELLRRDPVVPRLALLMRDHQLESMAELDALLRHYGSSLEKQIRYYGENLLGRSIMGNHIRQNPDVTHQEMLDYYNAHAADYALTAKARFEILTVKFANFPDRTQAWNAICAMGNEVFFGKEFAAVARQSSQEPNAANGGYYDWISQGSLASEPIDRAVFTLEVGKLSQVIEDATGFHIVRVKERQEAGSVSFVDAQPKIKEAIKKEKREADYKKFLAGLGTRTKVWTVFEEDVAIAKQPGSGMQR